MNKKDKVKNYIISLIIGKHVLESEKIPSEMELAVINKCSRNPVREALKELTYSSWIQPRKGSGYYVTSFGNYEASFAKGALKIDKTRIRDLNSEEEFYLKIINNKPISHTRIFVKEYLKKKQIIMKTINIVNNDFMFYLDKKELKLGFIQSLLNHRIKITHQNRKIKINELTTNDKITFGWKNECPLVIAELFCNKQIIERSVLIIKKDYFDFQKKIIF